MRYQVKAPAKRVNDTIAGVRFNDSIAEVDGELLPSALAYFRRQGYTLVEIQAVPEPEETPAPAPAEPKPPFAPNRGSSKAEWVAYVTGPNAGDKALDQAAAEAKTRDQLAEHVLGPKEGADQ